MSNIFQQAAKGQASTGKNQDKSVYWVNIGTMSEEGKFISNFGASFDKLLNSSKQLNGTLALKFKELAVGESCLTEIGKGIWFELKHVGETSFDENNKMALF